MKLGDKLRYLREVEGELRGMRRPLTQGELVRALQDELGEGLSQSYLSQIESGARPHMTHTSRALLARFFRVHPGFLVDDPEGEDAERMRFAPGYLDPDATPDAILDRWLISGAEIFRRDPPLRRTLLTLAEHPDSRGCLLLLQAALAGPDLAERLAALQAADAASESVPAVAGAGQ